MASWLGLSYALGTYFHHFADLNYTYGALGGIIALMLWLYWSFFVILLGAEINGEAEKAQKFAPSKPIPPQKDEKKTAADTDKAA